jgi:hypothetical protein
LAHFLTGGTKTKCWVCVPNTFRIFLLQVRVSRPPHANTGNKGSIYGQGLPSRNLLFLVESTCCFSSFQWLSKSWNDRLGSIRTPYSHNIRRGVCILLLMGGLRFGVGGLFGFRTLLSIATIRDIKESRNSTFFKKLAYWTQLFI